MAVTIPSDISNKYNIDGRVEIPNLASEDSDGNKIIEFGKDVIRGIARPVVKSFLAPGVLVETLRTGKEIKDLELPFLGDVTPSKTVRGAIGTSLQTGLLGIGGGAIGGLNKQLLKTIGKEALIGGGFGLGVGLEEEAKGKELVLPTVLGVGLGALAPVLFAGGRTLTTGVKIPLNKLRTNVSESFQKLAETIPVKFVTSVRERLKQFGDPGEKILEGFEKIDREQLLRVGRALDNLEQVGFNKLDKVESKLLLDALEGRIKPNNLSSGTRAVFEVIDNLRREIADEAKKIGLKVRIQKGLERPFFPRKNFFPHFIPSVKELKNKKFRQEVIENAVNSGRFKTSEEAEKVLDSYIEFVNREGRGGDFWIEWLVNSGQAKNKTEARGLALRVFKQARLKKFNQLEKSRIIDFPFYDPDPKRVIPKYLFNSFERLETVKTFGQNANKLNNLVGRIHNLKGYDAGKEAALLLKNITGAIDRSPKAEQFSLFLRSLQIPKLAFAQIVNIGQPIANGILKSNIPAVAFGLSKAFTQLGRRRALRSGATVDTAIRQVIAKAGAEGTFASKFLKLTGFTATEKFNRIVSANTGMRYLEQLVKKLKKNPTDKITQRRIKELGLNPTRLLREPITERDLLIAGQKFTNITQFRNRPIDLPEFVNSPFGKVTTQFKTFAFNQSKLLKDAIKQDLIDNNYSGILKTLLILGTVFPMTGEVLQDIRSLVTRRPRPTDALDRYIDNIVSAGGMGIVSDLWRSADFGALTEALAGPTISSGARGVENIVQSINRGEVTKGTLKWIMDQFGVLRPLKNIIFPPKVSDRRLTEKTKLALSNVKDEIEKDILPVVGEDGKIENLLLLGAIGATSIKSAKARRELTDLTIKTIEGLKGKTKVSKEFIENLTRRPGVRQAERNLVREVLDTFDKGKIAVKDFIDKVNTRLLPLERESVSARVGSTQYENITLPDELRGNVANYDEILYRSPIVNSAGDIHFSGIGGEPKYFAHTRVEDLPTPTRRIIELQSDLFQRGRLDSEYPLKKSLAQQQIEEGENPEIWKKLLKAREKELSQLQPYRNTWYERIIREEIKRASQDGKTKLQFPTGETAMKIEGIGAQSDVWSYRGGGPNEYFSGGTLRPHGLRQLEQENIGVGTIISRSPHDQWVITDVLGDGKFKAVPKEALDFERKSGMFINQNISNERMIKEMRESGVLNNRTETFDISGKVDTDNPIYKFYEKDVQKFLKRIHPEMKRITDNQGVEWFEITPTEKDATDPIQAFGALLFGKELTEE